MNERHPEGVSEVVSEGYSPGVLHRVEIFSSENQLLFSSPAVSFYRPASISIFPRLRAKMMTWILLLLYYSFNRQVLFIFQM